MRVRESVTYGMLQGIVYLSKVMPKRWVYGMCHLAGSAFYRLLRRRRDITLRNIRLAYPQWSEDEVVRVAKASYREVSNTVAEILLLLHHRIAIDASIVNRHEVLDRLAALQKQYPHGWVLLTAHFGNWELLAQFLGLHGFTMLIVGREGDNRLIEERLTQPFRQRYGNQTVFKKHASVKVMKHLKRQGRVGILMDQKVHPQEGVAVRFFGRKSYASGLVGALHHKLPIAVIPIFAVREGRERFRIELGDPVEKGDDAIATTQRYNDAMEAVIRRYPQQWLWMHDRWKQFDNDTKEDA